MKKLIEQHYDLSVTELSVIPSGIGGITYYVNTDKGKYVLKGNQDNEYLKNEPYVAECLRNNNIPAADYIKTDEGEYFWNFDNKEYFLQSFIDGKVFEYNCAPVWFMKESAQTLGKMHKCLASMKPLPAGMGINFINYMFSGQPAKDYEKTLAHAVKSGDKEIERDIRYRLSQLGRLNKNQLDFDRLTRLNTHGDYKISNIVCGDRKINAVIDLSNACVHPIVWEIIRSFVYAETSCRNGEIDILKLIEYTKDYLEFSRLTEYDLKTMPFYFYFQILVSNYYEQYYNSKPEDKEDVMKQAVLSTNLIRWFENNIDELSAALVNIV